MYPLLINSACVALWQLAVSSPPPLSLLSDLARATREVIREEQHSPAIRRGAESRIRVRLAYSAHHEGEATDHLIHRQSRQTP